MEIHAYGAEDGVQGKHQPVLLAHANEGSLPTFQRSGLDGDALTYSELVPRFKAGYAIAECLHGKLLFKR